MPLDGYGVRFGAVSKSTLGSRRATTGDVVVWCRKSVVSDHAGAWIAAVMVASAALLPLFADPTAAQGASPAWQTDTKAAEPAPAARPAVPPANTTIVPRTRPPQTGKDGQVLVALKLSAHLTDDGQAIDQGLVWRIFEEVGGGQKEGKSRLVRTVREAAPGLSLPKGAYIVVVSFGRAHMTKRVKLTDGDGVAERFVINAGGLRVNAMLQGGKTAPDMAVHYDLYAGETDQQGSRRRVMAGAKPGLIIRLNAGIYHVVSTYGDANAVVRADVTVEAGKLTEASIQHAGSPVTFKLVARPGGEAQSGAQWVIMTTAGEKIKETAGALPTHVLATGSYIVNARHSGRTFRANFAVESGEPMQVEVIME